MVDEEGLPAGKQAGRSATVPALQFKPDVVVAALVGREWSSDLPACLCLDASKSPPSLHIRSGAAGSRLAIQDRDIPQGSLPVLP